MLVISRRFGERVLVGDAMILVDRSPRGDKVRLCIEAPVTTRVVREELLLKERCDGEEDSEADRRDV